MNYARDAVAAAYKGRWAEALDVLTQGAEAGDIASASQLRVLSQAPFKAPYRDMRARIDAQALITPPPFERLSERASVAALRGFATPAMCAWLIARARDGLGPSTVNAPPGEKPHSVRTAQSCAFGPQDRDMVLAVFQARAARAARGPVEFHEAPNVISYERGEEFSVHVDFVDPAVPDFARELAVLGQRTVTFVTYLNEDFDGAETHFPALGFKFRGRTGDALVFSNVHPDGSPDRNTVHAGLPPTRGRKWVLSQWLRNKPQPYNL